MSHSAITYPAAAALLRGVALAGLFLLHAAARADCVDGVREPKPAERDFHSRAIAALVAALPPAPPGAKLTGNVHDFKRLPAIELLCRDQKEGDFAVDASRSYVIELSEAEFVRRRAEREAIFEQQVALEMLPPEQKAQRQTLEKKASAGYAAAEAARQVGNQAAAKAREAEAHDFSRQAREMQRAHDASVRPQMEELTKRMEAIALEGQQAAVRVAINVARLPPATARNPVGAFGAASPAKSAGLKVYNVVWRVNGPDSPLRQAMAAAIDRAYLQSLVGKPLPSQAQSEAYAAKAVPALVPALVPEITAGAPSPEPASTAPAAGAASARTSTTATPPLPPTSPPPPSSPPMSAPTPPAADAPSAADLVQKAAEAVNKLRGLFGR